MQLTHATEDGLDTPSSGPRRWEYPGPADGHGMGRWLNFKDFQGPGGGLVEGKSVVVW